MNESVIPIEAMPLMPRTIPWVSVWITSGTVLVTFLFARSALEASTPTLVSQFDALFAAL